MITLNYIPCHAISDLNNLHNSGMMDESCSNGIAVFYGTPLLVSTKRDLTQDFTFFILYSEMFSTHCFLRTENQSITAILS